MGYLEEMHGFTEVDVNTVIRDIDEEFELPPGAAEAAAAERAETMPAEAVGSSGQMDERMVRLEKSIVSVLSILKKIVATPAGTPVATSENRE
jgi:general secretion pathway protein A